MSIDGNRVLVVDDDAGLVRALAINLRAHGWDVTVAMTGAEALDAAASARPDVILLDLGLPDLTGFEVIEGVRGWSAVPIVVLSARQLGDDKVDALDAGADDYVTKPFAMNELLARLRAAVRRAQPAEVSEPVVEAGDLLIDLARRRVLRAGQEVRLSPTEWSLLEVLVRHRGRMVGRLQLLHDVWGPAYSAETNYLRVYTAQLRRKLEDDPANPRHIITQPGMGYLFEV
ncbi:response regulator transcription factor [Oerskovia turbata]|uniref:Transcriptional regulatory protein KdpE n=1 Tax=Oerskovia turbata TaxID=1713 RepID=A0A4Q1L1F9_9CELL|nr:response regulator transcription factor [Oerskovia turbata]RXR28101.1 response regulator transcription factor [Oerskovia turbata]RXR35890.1 response regulator transcription factor [Oerskovia turbata]TGJ94579.1 DNA-binding response regulator [Actinotalea fermentans ATCC 43279 = JCM 9966 = DSM 3133]